MLFQLGIGVIVAYGGIVGVMYLAQRSPMEYRFPNTPRHK